MTTLLPADRSRAVLIGCSRYAQFEDLPSVATNLRDLAAALGEPTLWGLPAANCTVVSDDPGSALPPSRSAVIEAVDQAAQSVGLDGLLLIYYAGHGLIERDSGELHLAVTGSREGQEDVSAVGYESIRRRVWRSRAAHRLVILDCCYSGRALVGEMSAAGLGEDTEIDRSVIITASSRNRTALAPPGERNTAFTGTLLDILHRGLAGGPAVLDARTIYREVRTRHRATGRPLPELRSRNAADDIPLVRNIGPVGEPARPRDATDIEPLSLVPVVMSRFRPESRGYRYDDVHDWVTRLVSGELGRGTPTVPEFAADKKAGLNRAQVDAYLQTALQVPADPLYLADGFAVSLSDIVRRSPAFGSGPSAPAATRARTLCCIPDSEPLVAVYEHRQQHYSLFRQFSELIVFTPWGLRIFNEANGSKLGVRYSDMARIRMEIHEYTVSTVGLTEDGWPSEEKALDISCHAERVSLMGVPRDSRRYDGIQDVLEKVKNLVIRTAKGR